MRIKPENLMWGVLLIILGALALAYQAEWIPEWNSMTWVIVLGVLGLISLVGYLLSDWKNWGLLFPAVGLLGGALVIWLVEGAEIAGEEAGGLLLMLISIPFWIGFLVDRQRFWWSLIPGWSTFAVGLLLILVNPDEEAIFGSAILFAIALPFYVVFFARRQHWWALIVAVVMTVLAFAPLLKERSMDDLIGALLMGGIAIAFFIVYRLRPDFWWAILTAGVTATLAITIILDLLNVPETLASRLIGGVIFGGLAITFAFLYYRRERYPTEWAIYPAAGLGAAAFVYAIFGSRSEVVWALLLITFGIIIIAGAVRSKEKEEPAKSPADKTLE